MNIIQNNGVKVCSDLYDVYLDSRRGGSIQKFVGKGGDSYLFREGCEMWDRSWGAFHPWHYQQERGGIPTVVVDHNRVTVTSNLGRNKAPYQPYLGNCKNIWCFRDDTPLVSCDFQISHITDKKLGLTQFKKYVGLIAKRYQYWAYKVNGKVILGKIVKRNKTYQFQGSLFAEWITFFNDTQGFALIPLKRDTWINEGIPSTLIWVSQSMAELLCKYLATKKEVSLSIGYLSYPTNPTKKWKPIEEWIDG